MSINTKIGLVSLMILLACSSYGDVQASFQAAHFAHYSTRDGLSHGNISAMLKDRRGFLWLATWDGLNRFDGREFVVYKPGDLRPGSSNRIERLHEDKLGYLWLWTSDQQVFRWSHKLEQLEYFGPGEGPLASWFFASNGCVFLLSQGGNLLQLCTQETGLAVQAVEYELEELGWDPSTPLPVLAEDARGQIWLTAPGAARLYQLAGPGEKLSFLKAFSLDGEKVLCSLKTQEGLALGTEEGSLWLWRGEGELLQKVSLPGQPALGHLSSNHQGQLYAATRGQGVWVVDVATGRLMQHFPLRGNGMVLKTFPDSGGRLWVETNRAGVFKIDLDKGEVKHFLQQLVVPEDLRSEAQMGIVEDARGRVWTTLKGGGFGCYLPEEDRLAWFFNQPGEPDSRFSNFVHCFYIDEADVVWMSTYFKGLEKVDLASAQILHWQPGGQGRLSIDNEVRALMCDSHGHLWVATKAPRLFVLNEAGDVLWETESLGGVESGRIYALMEHSDGRIFVGTRGQGLFILSGSLQEGFKVEHFHSGDGGNGLGSDHIYSLAEDSGGGVWVATFGGGLNRYAQGRIWSAEELGYPVHLADRIRHLFVDTDDRLWMASTKGLLVGTPDSTRSSASTFRFSHLHHQSPQVTGFQGSDVFWVSRSSRGTLLLAVLGVGLLQLCSEEGPQGPWVFETLAGPSGPPGASILTLCNDSQGDLWLSSGKGLLRYQSDRNSFQRFALPGALREATFSEGAVARSPSGVLYYGTMDGVYYFQPEALESPAADAALRFTRFYLHGQELLPGTSPALPQALPFMDGLRLKHRQNTLGFEWTALHPQWSQRATFTAFLKGYDELPRQLGEQNRVDYARLPPGRYLLEIAVEEADLQEKTVSLQLPVYILPPPWLQAWAYVLYVLLGVGLLFLIRKRLLLWLQRREQKAADKALAQWQHNAFLMEVLKILEELHTRPGFRMAWVYQRLGMGRSKFFEEMKRLTGKAPSDFLKDYRLRKALSLLAHEDYNISEVALLAGFSDAGYFSKCFKEKYGQAPSEFKKAQLHR